MPTYYCLYASAYATTTGNYNCNCALKNGDKLSDLLSTEDIAKYSKYVKEELEKLLQGHFVVNSPKERKLFLIKQNALFFQNVEAKKLKYNLTI